MELGNESRFENVMSLMEKSLNDIFITNNALKSLKDKIQQRCTADRNDVRVPPGSSTLIFNFSEPRYRISSIFVEVGKWLYTNGEFNESTFYFHQAYMWFPKSAEALYYFAESRKMTSYDEQDLLFYENVLRKAVTYPVVSCDDNLDEITKHKVYAEKSGNKLLLYLLQTSRSEEADSILRNARYCWRISEKVINYRSHWNTVRPASLANLPFVIAIDNFLRVDQFNHLHETFKAGSAFWKEHKYDPSENFSKEVGYFSYIYPFLDRPAVCSIEQIINNLYGKLCSIHKPMEEATIAEWWVHSRPHSNGHQMHFDSDETRLRNGGNPQHPIVSCIIYLSDAGGPTLVTDQTLKSELASQGIMVQPTRNRLVVFDARFLHGVIPGVGICPLHEERRSSFMVGFWRKLDAKDLGANQFGAGQHFPQAGSNFTWHRSLQSRLEWDNSDTNHSVPNESCYGYVDEIWKNLRENGEGKNYKDFFQGF